MTFRILLPGEAEFSDSFSDYSDTWMQDYVLWPTSQVVQNPGYHGKCLPAINLHLRRAGHMVLITLENSENITLQGNTVRRWWCLPLPPLAGGKQKGSSDGLTRDHFMINTDAEKTLFWRNFETINSNHIYIHINHKGPKMDWRSKLRIFLKDALRVNNII